MPIRVASVCLAALFLVACDDNGKDQSKQASNICKGLSQTDCAAKTECQWDAEDDKCRRKKVDDKAPEATSPTDQAPAPEPTPAPETAPAPEAPKQTPAPETTPPQ